MRRDPLVSRVAGRRLRLMLAGAMAVLALALLVPEPAPPTLPAADRPVFAWRLDAFWSELESDLVEARSLDRGVVSRQIDAANAIPEALAAALEAEASHAVDTGFRGLEGALFRLAPLLAAQPDRLADYIALMTRACRLVKAYSRAWDLNAMAARDRLYRLVFGSRMALEQVLLQVPVEAPFPDLVRGVDEPSATPSTVLLGVTLHSGDILVSRGDAPTSALIARGNDYPGVFSHVALVHVEAESGRASFIESHIERGVALATIQEYLEDKKLRILVLRPRADLPALVADPMLPHRAATAALAEARRRHIPYDFAMDCRDPRAMFCSEVASAAYEAAGLRLWMGVSFLSSPTVRAWLASIGVRHFETQEPADLEYDSQLSVVAEWRDRATLFRAHVDDAVTDAMIEAAPPGQPLPYRHLLLPLARVSKAYSLALNAIGRVGPVPEGMSATAALRVDQYRADHQAIVARVLALAQAFTEARGYPPPYWELVRLARQACEEPCAE